MNKIRFFNTLSRTKEEFIPIIPEKVGLYCCGPTVYNYAHIGNLRSYFFEDILKRVLLYNGYEVNHIMNVTDVGHLVSDADEGEDKMEKGAAREGRTVWEIAEFYLKEFQDDISKLNILSPSLWCRATEHIKEQIEMIKCLEDKGFTYLTKDGVYFDTSKFPDYGKLGLLDIEGLEEGKRIKFSDEKKNKTDFALWKFSPENQKRQMEWDSPWGIGFPGWHIECSAMSSHYLGKTFDIHCGGVDHIPIHHTNEIAQSEGCSGQKFVNYWLHGEFLIEEKGKMSKSAGVFLRLQTLIDKGYSPLDFRYFLLMTHYRKKIKFSFENLDAAKNGYENLKNRIRDLMSQNNMKSVDTEFEKTDFKKRFTDAINDDLNVTEAMSVLWDLLKDDGLSPSERLAFAYDFDKIFGLDLDKIEPYKVIEIPDEITLLAEKRIQAKKSKDFKSADDIRNLIKQKGYEIIDKKDGYELKKLK